LACRWPSIPSNLAQTWPARGGEEASLVLNAIDGKIRRYGRQCAMWSWRPRPIRRFRMPMITTKESVGFAFLNKATERTIRKIKMRGSATYLLSSWSYLALVHVLAPRLGWISVSHSCKSSPEVIGCWDSMLLHYIVTCYTHTHTFTHLWGFTLPWYPAHPLLFFCISRYILNCVFRSLHENFFFVSFISACAFFVSFRCVGSVELVFILFSDHVHGTWCFLPSCPLYTVATTFIACIFTLHTLLLIICWDRYTNYLFFAFCALPSLINLVWVCVCIYMVDVFIGCWINMRFLLLCFLRGW
jgi:hypothetical protein